MTSKYFGLPDIDTAQDVFETADEPEPALRPHDLAADDDDFTTKVVSEDIDASGLPGRRKAEKVFGKGSRRADPSLRFRPRLPPLARRRSSSSASSSDGDIPPETPAARLRRLKAELAEVEQELAAGPSSATISNGGPGSRSASADGEGKVEGKRKSVLPPRPPVDLVGELNSLRTRLESLDVAGGGALTMTGDWSNRLRRLGEEESEGGPSGATERTQGDAEASAHAGVPVSLSEIDKRLAMLEDTIGPSDSSTSEIQTSAPLLTTLNKLDHLLALLTQPRHLDAISRRVKLLLVDLDRAAAASRRQPSAPSTTDKSSSNVTLSEAEYQSLQSLFTLLPRLDPLLPIIPPLLARLRSLSGLHAEAGQVTSGLRKLQEGDKRQAEQVKELMGVVQGVNAGLDGAGKAVEQNWQGLETRLKDLEGRIRALSKH